MENKLTPELLEKAKYSKTSEELAAFAKENGTELTAEEANTLFAELNPQSDKLSDDDLDRVAGGGTWGISINGRPLVSAGDLCEHWKRKKCHRALRIGAYFSRVPSARELDAETKAIA